MDRPDVIARLKSVESALRAGCFSLVAFRIARPRHGDATSDIDVFVDAGHDSFYDLSNFMGAYEELKQAFPGRDIGYSTRDGLSKYVRPSVEAEAIRVF